MIKFQTFLERKGWSITSVDIAQAKGDQTTAEFRDTWNYKWKSIQDVICSKDFLNCKPIDKIVKEI